MDADTKEALEEKLTNGKVGVQIIDPDSDQRTGWVFVDGTLWMGTSVGSFAGDVRNTFDLKSLEQLL